MPPLDVASDCQALVDGSAIGRGHGTGATEAYAEEWRALWRAVDDFGGEQLSVRKVKAHASLGDEQAGRISAFDRAGNMLADQLAKRGAGRHPRNLALEAEADRQQARAKAVAWHLA
eukprot:8596696-Lingulodinium_polyedra.AAC.1